MPSLRTNAIIIMSNTTRKKRCCKSTKTLYWKKSVRQRMKRVTDLREDGNENRRITSRKNYFCHWECSNDFKTEYLHKVSISHRMTQKLKKNIEHVCTCNHLYLPLSLLEDITTKCSNLDEITKYVINEIKQNNHEMQEIWILENNEIKLHESLKNFNEYFSIIFHTVDVQLKPLCPYNNKITFKIEETNSLKLIEKVVRGCLFAALMEYSTIPLDLRSSIYWIAMIGNSRVLKSKSNMADIQKIENDTEVQTQDKEPVLSQYSYYALVPDA